ncbi:MAG: kelch repeat-containing protein [Elusimicrobiales bacterium]
MKALISAAAMLACLFTVQAAAQKTAGDITVLGDAADYSSASAGQSHADGTVLQGGLAGAAHGTQIFQDMSNDIALESGFYSRLVSSAAVLDYSAQGGSSYTLVWTEQGGPYPANPPGTTYDFFVSTWAEADPYMVTYSTDEHGYPVEGLAPNTSYYNFLIANYMEGDYSAPASSTAVTMAVVPSTGEFTLADAGHGTLGLAFAYSGNPPPLLGGWETAGLPGALPAPRSGSASVVYGSHVYVSGGFDGIYFSSAVFRAEINGDGSLGGWSTAGYMPAGLYGHQAVAARGRLYILGGSESGAARNEVWSADISSSGVLGVWLPEAGLGEPVYLHAATLAENRIYVSGGYKSGVGVLSGLAYAEIGPDGALSAWQGAGEGLPAPRYGHSLTALEGRLLLAGGSDGAAVRAEAWTYDPDTEDWTAYAPLPSPRYGHAAAAAGNRLYVFGGNNGYGPQRHVFHSSVPVAGIAPWEAGPPMPAERQFPAVALAGPRLYLFGGSPGSTPSDSVYSAAALGAEYQAEVALNSGFTGAETSGWSASPSFSFSGLQPLTQYYYRARARNWAGVATQFSQAGSTFTYAAVPGTAAWTNVWVSSATVNWTANGNPPGSDYSLVYSSHSDYSHSFSLSAAGVLSAVLTGLQQSTTYYARVRLEEPEKLSRYAELPAVRTGFDPALDISSPTIDDQQGNIPGWQSTNTFLCDVNFTDVGAAGLDRIEVRVSTREADPASFVGGWTPVLTGIDQESYSADWPLTQQAWDIMLDGASNYVSIRAYDRSGNYGEVLEAFMVRKDTTPPSVESGYAAPEAWLTDYPGDVAGLDFGDPLSGLARVQFSVSASKNFADGAVIPWTDISGLTAGATWYRPTLTYSFNALANATSNYFSFRAVDVAGSTRTLTDAFGIAKNVSGPVVTISTPTALFLSTFTRVAGGTAETNAHQVKGTEVSIRDLASLLYYNGGDFLSGSQAWQDAQDFPSSYTIIFQNLPLIGGRQYQVVARSSDSAGDYSQLLATHTFTFDAGAPDAAVLYPADGSTSPSVASVSGTAADPHSGIASVDVALKRLSDGKWWKNSVSEWAAAPEPLQAGTTPYWTWTFQPYLRDSLVHGASYYVTVRASDLAVPVNTGAFYASGSTFTYSDATPPPPTAGLAAVPGAFSGAVNLSWPSAGDNAAGGYLPEGSYKIAYSTYAGAPVSTDTAQVAIATASVSAGTTRYWTLTGLDPAAVYYFTLWTADDAQNWSAASSEASALSGAPGSGALTGRVTDAAAQPLTGVLVEARSPAGALEGSDYTDAFGDYSIPGVDSLYLTLRAVWTAQDIESSVSKDNVPNGSSNVNFSLSVSYQLASILGVIPSNYLPAASAARPATARYTTREARVSSGAEPFVEVYSRGRRIGAAYTDAAGAFEIPNLLPGTYSLRVFNGSEFSRMETVKLGPGERLVFAPKWDLLNKAGVFAYPNPASTEVHFHFPQPPEPYEAEAQIFDVSGRLLRTLDAHAPDLAQLGGRRLTWDLVRDGAASGVYLYVLRIKGLTTGRSEKVVKKFAVVR